MPERSFREILAAIPEPLAVHDSEWNFRYVNPAAATVFQKAGHGGDAIVGKNLWTEYPDILGTRFEREMRRAASERTVVQFEEYYPKHGTWSEIRCHPLPDDGLLTIWRDVTLERRARETLHYLSKASDILSSS